jgi:hypothetical protein
MATLAVKKEQKIKGFAPSKNGLKFPNRFPGLPLPDALTKFIDTSKSVHGLCGGMCFTVIDYTKSKKKAPEVNAVPQEETPLYHYLAKRQLASWGTMSMMVLRYAQWMTFSDDKAQSESLESWQHVKKQLDDGEFQVLGLIYHDLHESLAVWDNHQVLAYGYTELADGSAHIHVYDPNYPKNDNIHIEVTPVKEGGKVVGVKTAQYKDEKKIHPMHGFLVVPYDYEEPPDKLG